MGAILKSTNPEITVDEIDTRLKGTSFDVKRYNESQSSQGRFMNNYHSLWDGVGMIQFCNALGLEKLAAPNEINLKDKVYVGEQTCTITCPDEDAIILYTTKRLPKPKDLIKRNMLISRRLKRNWLLMSAAEISRSRRR